MDFKSLYFVTQSMQAIIISLFFVTLIILIIYLVMTVRKIKTKMIEAADEGIEAAEEAKEYINKVGKTAIDYLIIKIFGVLTKNKKRKE